MPNAIHISTSGWSYDDWVGPFYPPGTPKGDYLHFYATRFREVEVDSTYYAIPARRTVQSWADKTPDAFRFSLKMPKIITHEKVLADCEAATEQFLDVLEPLRNKTRCVLLQFGYFNRRAFGSAGPFLDRLRAFLERFASRIQLACEIRNKQWLTRDYFDLLRGYGVPAVLVEHAWLPPIDRVIAQHDVATGPFGYVRLIGDRAAIEKLTRNWSEVVLDRGRDLKRVATAIRKMAERTDVVTFVNNHYAGHGPATCADLERLTAGPT